MEKKGGKVIGYHFRAVGVPVGQIIPATCVPDQNIPEELWRVPLVWFTMNEKDIYDPYGADPMFRHTIEVDPKAIKWDESITDWGATAEPAVVKEIVKMKNPWVADE